MNFEIASKETEVRLTWDEAIMYCFALNVDGKSGWRLPTKDELKEIYYAENDYELDWYWSSTECGGIDAWVQNFGNAAQYSYHHKNNGYYVRAIRDLQ
jgi:hypothetical protein